MTSCPICLSDFSDPVCIPCGHVYCKSCLTNHANEPGNDRLTAKCPECRASFDLMLPDLTYLPEKYHRFITHNVRRTYIDFSYANKLRASLKTAEERLAQKSATEQALLIRCEELTKALSAHCQGERGDAKQPIHGLVLDKEQGSEVDQKEKDGEELLTVKIVTDDTFSRHETFDLAVFDNGNQSLPDLPTFCVPRHETYIVFKGRVAQRFDCPENQIRLWTFCDRVNKTTRPERYLRDQNSSSLGAIRRGMTRRRKDLLLYLEIIPAPLKILLEATRSILVFFKHFNPTTQTLIGVGKIHVPRARKVSVLIPIINERMGWASQTPLRLYEEIKPGMIEFMNPNRTFTKSDIGNGDIICFQMVISDEAAHDLETRGLYSNPLQFYDSLHNRVINNN